MSSFRDFLDNGEDICHPDAAILEDDHGVLHDDGTGTNVNCQVQNCGSSEAGAEQNGYASNLDCGVRLRAPRGGLVNVHFSSMNLEGPESGVCSRQNPERPDWCDCDPMEDPDCFDYVEIRDGPNENAPLLARVSNDATDMVNSQDSYTSTGRNMFIKFHTDSGNGGLGFGQGAGFETSQDPGFYLEWQMIDDGQACERFVRVENSAIVGHNNEQLRDVTVQECEAACCARAWCKSFDYTDSDNHCNLADIDASRNMAETTSRGNWVLYEKPESVISEQNTAALGPTGCADMLASISNDVNSECCGGQGDECSNGAPHSCSEECANVWLPFARQCSTWLDDNGNAHLHRVTLRCENTEYGRYKPNRARGRCNDDDLQEFMAQMAPACCGGDSQYCDPSEAAISSDGSINLPTPMQNGQLFCGTECASVFEEFYSECHPRLERFGTLLQLLHRVKSLHVLLCI
eukprot:SAG31_NODE_2730_length_5177_cov_2.436392_2_plen_462_part_00